MRTILAAVTGALLLTAAGGGTANAQVYLRGDLGLGWATDAGIRDKAGAGNPGCLICQPGSFDDLGNSAVIGAGAGYRFSDLLRADATVSYRGGFRWRGSDVIGTSYRANVSSWALMANGYVDLPLALGPIRPFVNAGIGVAWNKMGAIQQSWAASSLSSAGTETDPSGSTTNFAWNVGAGLAWAILPNLSADLAYRYVDLGDIETKAGISQATFTPGGTFQAPTAGVRGNLRANEVVLSLRYAF